MGFVEEYLMETIKIIEKIETIEIEKVVLTLVDVRKSGGRLFIIGSGGGAGYASHAVCDFRKICDFEAYAPYDNVTELTARVNDDGWDISIVDWLKVSKFNNNDCIFVFSVGGGNDKKNISPNIVEAIKYAKVIGAKIVGIVGKDGGYTKKMGDAVIIIPPLYGTRITPHTEGLQAVLWHLLVSHPKLQVNMTKWESTK